MTRVLDLAIDKHSDIIRVVRVDVDKNEDTEDEANVTSLPAVHFWMHGQRVREVSGKVALASLDMQTHMMKLLCSLITKLKLQTKL